MLTLFPELLPYTFFAITLLRVTAAGFFLYLAWKHLFKERLAVLAALSGNKGVFGTVALWYLGAAELVAGALLLVGYLTQAGAILGTAIAAKKLLFGERVKPLLVYSRSTYLLLLVLSLSLIITGSGPFAFDLPL